MDSNITQHMLVEMFKLIATLAEKSRFSNEQELMTYQKGLEFAETYYDFCKKGLRNDTTTESLS